MHRRSSEQLLSHRAFLTAPAVNASASEHDLSGAELARIHRVPRRCKRVPLADKLPPNVSLANLSPERCAEVLTMSRTHSEGHAFWLVKDTTARLPESWVGRTRFVVQGELHVERKLLLLSSSSVAYYLSFLVVIVTIECAHV